MLQTQVREKPEKIDWQKANRTNVLYCQCTRCKDCFSVAGVVKRGIVSSLESHPHIKTYDSSGLHLRKNGTQYLCHCGGKLNIFRNF